VLCAGIHHRADIAHEGLGNATRSDYGQRRESVRVNVKVSVWTGQAEGGSV
jgi:hypothetical protein